MKHIEFWVLEFWENYSFPSRYYCETEDLCKLKFRNCILSHHLKGWFKEHNYESKYDYFYNEALNNYSFEEMRNLYFFICDAKRNVYITKYIFDLQTKHEVLAEQEEVINKVTVRDIIE